MDGMALVDFTEKFYINLVCCCSVNNELGLTMVHISYHLGVFIDS